MIGVGFQCVCVSMVVCLYENIPRNDPPISTELWQLYQEVQCGKHQRAVAVGEARVFCGLRGSKEGGC